MIPEPKFTDPRVERRIKQALAFCQNWLSTSRPQWLSTREIDRHFGMSARPLCTYLKQELLICVDPYFNGYTGRCKKYILNKKGFDQLSIRVGMKQSTEVIDQYRDELESGVFEYNDTSNRKYHPIQNIKRAVKKSGLARYGYRFNYDIVACAPTLLLQHARKLGLSTPTPTVDQYLIDRTQMRQAIATDTGIQLEKIKVVVNALFQGAYLSHFYGTRILTELDNNDRHIHALKLNTTIQLMRSEIKQIWQTIIPHMKRELTDKQKIDGSYRFKAITGRKKAELYRQLEQSVLTQIDKYLKKTNNTFLLEHDGWTCKEMIEVNDLIRLVRTNTGYVIDIDCEIIDYE